MIRTKTIQFIQGWIEQHLEQRISIDQIAQLSGYSRRYIQHVFKQKTGEILGDYIRRRKLCRAATLVRLTSMSMIDIAARLGYDSQQTFSREFKKLFGVSPRVYRNRDFWDLTQICPPWSETHVILPECKLYYLKEMTFLGKKKINYEISFEDRNNNSLRYKWLSRDLTKYNPSIYYLSKFKASTKNNNAIYVETFCGVKVNEVTSCYGSDILYLPSGMYASFHYEGLWADYTSLIRRIYLEALPYHGLGRVNGYDIEHFQQTKNVNWISCDYFIPVKKLND